MSEYGTGRWKDIRDDDRQGTGSKGLAYSGSAPTSGNVVVFDANGNASDGGSALEKPYDIVCAYIGKPGAGAKVFAMTFTRTVDFADEWAGSYGSVGANPTSTAAYSILKNGVACGSVSISTGGVFTFATTSPAGAISFAAGDRMVITAPDPQDATLEDVAFTLAGTR